jgi:CDP-diglyceride synthetase
MYSNYYSYYDYSPYTSNFSNSSSIDGLEALIVGVTAILGIIAIIIIALLVLQIIGMWKVFQKAGEKGWKAIIPFYNMAILYKISGMSPYLVFVYLGLLVPFVNIIVAAAIGVMSLYQVINLSKAFNKSTGFTVAIILVPFVAYLMLGFGKSEYIGFGEKVQE